MSSIFTFFCFISNGNSSISNKICSNDSETKIQLSYSNKRYIFLFFCNIFVKNICFSTVFCYVFHNFKKFSTIVLTYFIKFCYYMKSIKYIHFFLKTLKFLFAKKMDFFTKMLQTYQHLWITLWITFVERMIKWQSIKKN